MNNKRTYFYELSKSSKEITKRFYYKLSIDGSTTKDVRASPPFIDKAALHAGADGNMAGQLQQQQQDYITTKTFQVIGKKKNDKRKTEVAVQSKYFVSSFVCINLCKV